LTTESLVRDRQELKLDEAQRRVLVLAQVRVPQLVRERAPQLVQVPEQELALQLVQALQVVQPVHCGRCSRVRLRE
jgi:hypothetical protein